MSLLMLFNSDNDENIIGGSRWDFSFWRTVTLYTFFYVHTDKTEQFQIKNLCLSTILELLLTCKMYPRIGDRTQRFLHISRAASLPANSIGYVLCEHLNILHIVQLN